MTLIRSFAWLLLLAIASIGTAKIVAQEPEAKTPAESTTAAPPPAEQNNASPAESNSTSKPRGPTDPAELAAFVDGVMAAQIKDKHIAGATIAFVVDNKPFFAKGYGYADVENRKPVDPATSMFRIGSVSKLFTWTAVMRLAQEGKVDLDADVNKYLKGVQIPGTYPEPVTLKHLLAHTPGFEDHVIGLFGRSTDDLGPLGEILAKRLPGRVRKPGTLASYSNHGTAIAGLVVQDVSGMPWEEYIEQSILQPLGMQHTTVRQPAEDQLPADMSKGYAYSRGKYVKRGFEYVPPAPAGSMSASAGDMVKFLIMHLQNGTYEGQQILNEDTAKQMHSLLFTHDPRLEGMAYGFMRQRFGDELIVEHGGDTEAFHSFFVMVPERKFGFFVSYNTTTAGSARNTLFHALMERYFPPAVETPVKSTADFSSRAKRYPGQYGAIRHSYTTLAKIGSLFSVANASVDDDELVLSFNGDLTVRFVEIEPRLFKEVDGQRMAAFADDGESPSQYLYLSGSPVAWERLKWFQTPAFTLGLLIVCVGVFLSAVIGWPLAAFIGRHHDPLTPRTTGSKFASWLGWFTCVAALAILALSMIPFADSQQIAYGLPPLLKGLLMSTPVLAALVAGMLVCTVIAWWRGYWRASARWHYTTVLMAGLAFVWFLREWNLLGVYT
jgi:CubicO group peptidase (beta-lactamase class C family)